MKKIFIIGLSLFMFLAYCAKNCNIAVAKKKKSTSVQVIEYESFDGFNIKGKLYIPKKPKGVRVPLVILLHSLGKDRNSWQNLPDLIKQSGYACLVIDQRGHGKSIYNQKLKKRTWYYFTHKNFAKFPKDIVSAVQYVQNHYYKKVDTNQLMFVGADIGASAAVIAASHMNKKQSKVLSLVLISPTIKLKGLFLPIELVNFGEQPVLVFVSKTHKESLRDTYELKKYAQGHYSVRAYYRGGIGSLLYKEKPNMRYEIVDWAIKTFSPESDIQKKVDKLLEPKHH